MIEASKKHERRIRMPPAADLAAAWKMYFEDKFEKSELVRDGHARHALTAFDYIQSIQKPDETLLLTNEDIMTALKVLASRTVDTLFGSTPLKLNPSYVKLSEELFDSLRSLLVDTEAQQIAINQYLRILCFSGNTQRALDLLLSDKLAQQIGPHQGWHLVVLGFVGERNVDALRAVVGDLQKNNPSFLDELSPVLTKAFANLDAMEQAKQLYSRVKSFQKVDFYMTVVTAALRNNEIEWGQSIIQELIDSSNITNDAQRRHWDAIFVWAAGSGKSVDEVDRMMQVMVRRNSNFAPDTKTMNRLIAHAIIQNDAYMAERFLSLGAKWGVEPDALTYLYQMDYRLTNGDIDGAITAYHHLQDYELPNQEDVPRINRLIQSMCASDKHSFEKIMEIVDALNRRNAPFEADTTAALCILHLKRDEYYDVADLLRSQIGNYDTSERIRIRDAFFNFCLDRRNSVARVWDTYMIFHQVFDTETNREIRTAIMNEFLKRRRSDMAVHVFNHMREHPREDTRATLDTYVDMFVGIGRLADVESLEVVHNQMKLDMNIEPNTRLQNARMLAFLGCDKARSAFTFWHDIIASSEGPNFNSLLIVMRVCEKMPFGEQPAKVIWRQLRMLDVEVTPELFAAYVGALAGNDLVEDAKRLCEFAEKDYGIVPDIFM